MSRAARFVLMSSDLNLTLFFTDGVSLQTWQQVGMLDRELALYEALVGRGANVRFVTYGGKADLDLGRQMAGITVTANRWNLPTRWYQQVSPWRLPSAKHQIYKSNQIPGSLFAMRTARSKGACFIARSGYWWADFAERRHGSDSPEAREARVTEVKAFQGADAIVFTAEWIRSGAIERYKLNPAKVHVIPNYVETEIFKPEPAIKQIPFRVAYVGRLAPEKNLEALIEAVSALDVELIVIGEGPERKVLEKTVDQLSAEVRFLGRIDNHQLPAILNQAHAFVLPSLHEGQPKTLQEAMACGLPVVGCDVVGVRDLIEHDQTGLLCGTESGSIGAALERLRGDGDLRTRLGKNARAYVMEHFALEKIVEQELALYRELLT